MLEEIGRVAVFIICAQTLLHFRAKESYEKYIKLLISMIVLLLMLKPFVNYDSKNEEGFLRLIKGYEKELGEELFRTAMGQEQVEAVMQNMAEDALSQTEAMQNAAVGDELLQEGTEEGNRESSVIRVEKIQIGE